MVSSNTEPCRWWIVGASGLCHYLETLKLIRTKIAFWKDMERVYLFGGWQIDFHSPNSWALKGLFPISSLLLWKTMTQWVLGPFQLLWETSHDLPRSCLWHSVSCLRNELSFVDDDWRLDIASGYTWPLCPGYSLRQTSREKKHRDNRRKEVLSSFCVLVHENQLFYFMGFKVAPKGKLMTWF